MSDPPVRKLRLFFPTRLHLKSYASASQIGTRGPRMARGCLKMAHKRLAVNGKQVHLALETKLWPARGYFWPAREIYLARGQKYLRSTDLEK